MVNHDTELLFPFRVIPTLRDLRGESWLGLVDNVHGLEPDAPDALAFVLMMVRLDGCINCSADSYRAMQGCTSCAQQTIQRYRGSDQELLNNYSKARDEVKAFLNNCAKTKRKHDV